MRPTWKGFVSFGLVTIPVNLYGATVSHEELRFHLLHKLDDGRIRYKRTCEVCSRDVGWDAVVKGVPLGDGRYVEIQDRDFEKADVGARSTVDIQDFVAADEIDPMLLVRPAYLEPRRGSEKAYALLREALRRTNKVGIAKVVLRTREHLACVRPEGNALVLELMRFADEVRPPDELDLPDAASVRENELALAERLVGEMTSSFDRNKYRDEYRAKLEAIIAEKARGKEPAARGEAPVPTRVADLEAVLRRSLGKRRKGVKPAHPRTAGRKRRAG